MEEQDEEDDDWNGNTEQPKQNGHFFISLSVQQRGWTLLVPAPVAVDATSHNLRRAAHATASGDIP
jgi:hypothetical protein